TLSPPMNDHAGLAKRESKENADCIERDQRVDTAAFDDDEERRKHSEQENPVAENKLVSQAGELLREKGVARQNRGEAREIGEARVRRQHENQRCRDLRKEVGERKRPRLAEDRSRDLVDDCRGCPLPPLPIHDVETYGEVGDPQENGAENHAHANERQSRVTGFWFSERRDPIAYR